MTPLSFPRTVGRALCLALSVATVVPAVAQQQNAQTPRRTAAPATATAPARGGDYIVAVVNQELVTNREVEQRIERIKESAQRGNSRLPSDRELRQQVLDNLIDERVILTAAREAGLRVDDAELDRAVQAVATQNQLTVAQLQQRLREEGIELPRFRNNLRDQMIVERMRDREVQQRIRLTDKEVDDFIAAQNAASTGVGYNIAQILVRVPENATPAAIAESEARARSALQRVRSGEDFAAVARQLSEDSNRERGGEIGLRSAERLPELFVARVKDLRPGQVSPELLRSGAGFHVLKLVDRKEVAGIKIVQTRARHILLRTTPQQSAEASRQRLLALKREIERGGRAFEAAAREVSQDGSAPQGGDLGWVSPGAFVPEFEEAMNRLPVGAVSDPVVSRFGVHLIQVMERREADADPKQLREQARNALREQKFEEAYGEWVRDLRARAYVELREPPL